MAVMSRGVGERLDEMPKSAIARQIATLALRGSLLVSKGGKTKAGTSRVYL